MPETSLKTRIVLTFGTMLSMAMFLQSSVVLFVGMRTSIDEEIKWVNRFIQTIAVLAPIAAEPTSEKLSPEKGYDKFLEGYRQIFPCIFIEVDGEAKSELSSCRFREELLSRSQQAKVTKTAMTSFVGEEWQINIFGSEVALISVPLVNSLGQVYGSINAERSLLPIYSRYKKASGIAFCYLLVNVILFSSLCFFRFVRILFRPLAKLVSLAENYHPDEQSLMIFDDDDSPFRKLSISLNAFLDRIRRDNQRLRKTVSELERVNKELKEKNELVIRSEKLASTGRLSAGLAHEIGNPLTIVQGYVELLGREDLTVDEKRKFSGNAQKELYRIKVLIRQLLDYSRPLQTAKEIVAVNALILEVISFVSVEKSFADCRIRTNLWAEKDNLLIDKNALRQVIVNILFNAVDATAEKKNEREIIIASYNEKSDRDTFLGISVQDNGIGIAEENLEYVFDPFYTTKESGRGTGLGLFVCHTIIDRMGGHIKIFNRNPEGSEVKIILPITENAGSEKYK